MPAYIHFPASNTVDFGEIFLRAVIPNSDPDTARAATMCRVGDGFRSKVSSRLSGAQLSPSYNDSR